MTLPSDFLSYMIVWVIEDFFKFKKGMLVLFSQLLAFFPHLILFFVGVICGAYYLGEFTGSKMCLLAIKKQEVLQPVNLWWIKLFR